MKRSIFYILFVVVPALFFYVYTLYRLSTENLFIRGKITGINLIGHTLIPTVIAAVLIILSLYSLRFSKTKSFYIVLAVLFIVYLALSILPLFSSAFSLPFPATAQYIMNDLPWYAGYYGGTLLFGYLYNKKTSDSLPH